jgi:hypothetical protein
MGAYNAFFEDTQEQPNIVAPKKSPMFGKNPQLQPQNETQVDELDRLMMDAVERNQQKTQETPGILGKALGAGEVGLGALTGLISVPLSGVIGIGANLASGKFGTQAGIQEAEKAAAQTQQALTYQPKTQAGQDYAQQLQSAFEASKLPSALPEAQGLLAQRPQAPSIPKIRIETVPKPIMGGLQSAGAAATELPSTIRSELASAPEHLKQVYANVPEQKLTPHDLQYIKTHKLFNKFGDMPTEGQALQDPRIMSEEYNAQNKPGNEALHQKFAERDQKVINAIEDTKQRITPDVHEITPQRAANLTLEKILSNDEIHKESINKDYKALADANGGELPLDINGILNNADTALKKARIVTPKTSFLPKSVENILNDLRPQIENGEIVKQSQPIIYDDYLNIIKLLNNEYRKATAANDQNAAFGIKLVRDAFENTDMVGKTAEVNALAKKAKANAKARFDKLDPRSNKYIPAYQAAVEGDIRTEAEKLANMIHPAANQFIEKFYSNKTPEVYLNRLINEIGRDTPEHQGLNAALLEELKSRAGIRGTQGKPSQAAINKFVSDPIKGYANNLPTMLGYENLKELQDVADYARMTDHTAIPGSYANVSKSGMVVNAGPIGQALEKAGSLASSALEQAVNIKTGSPAGTIARTFLKGRAEEKAAALAKAEQEAKLRQTLNPKPPSMLSDLGTITIKGKP